MKTINFNKLHTLSGSGLIWVKEETKKSGRIDNILSYHVMSENGYYVGYCYFRIIPKDNNTDYKIQFIGQDSSYLNKQYCLKDFLEDTIYYHLEE